LVSTNKFSLTEENDCIQTAYLTHDIHKKIILLNDCKQKTDLTHGHGTEIELPHVRLQRGLQEPERDGGAEDAERGQQDGRDLQHGQETLVGTLVASSENVSEMEKNILAFVQTMRQIIPRIKATDRKLSWVKKNLVN
jgi:hypothetical protein